MMLDIKVSGCRSKNASRMYLDACRFYMKELMPRKKLRKKIKIRFAIIIGKLGYCSSDNDDFYEIVIHKPLNPLDRLWVLAHECYHIRQFERKLLKNNDAGLLIWRDKEYDIYEDERLNMWEREPYKKQTILAMKYIRHYMIGVRKDYE